jgi:hypothetical protein
MSMNRPDSLSVLLKSWKHDPPDEPQFNQQVWSRVQRSSSVPVHPTSRYLLPLAASVALLLSGVAGTTVAIALQSSARNDKMATAYAKSIDPLQRSLTVHVHAH